MATFSYGTSDPVEVDPENEAQYEAAGWSRIDEPVELVSKKSDKGDDK